MAMMESARPVAPGNTSGRSVPRPRLGSLWVGLDLTREGMKRAVPVTWGVGIPALAMALVFAGSLFEPAPAADHHEPALEAALAATAGTIVMVGALTSLWIGLMGSRLGLGIAAASALLTLGMVLACPISGHHTFGLWFAGELMFTIAAVGACLYGLTRTGRGAG